MQSETELLEQIRPLDEREFKALMQSLIRPGSRLAPDVLKIDKCRKCFAFTDLRGFIVAADKKYCWGGRFYNLTNGRSRTVRYQRGLEPFRLSQLMKTALIDLQRQSDRMECSQPDETRFYELYMVRQQAEQQRAEQPDLDVLVLLIAELERQLQELAAIHGAAWITDLLHHYDLKD